jgi:holin (3TMs family)
MPLLNFLKKAGNPTGSMVEDAAKGILGGASEVLDKLVTTDKERLEAKKQLSDVIMNGLNQFYATASTVILAEENGTWIQRSWRPLLMLSFGFIILCTYFFFPLINIWAKNPDIAALISDLKTNADFWSLLKIGIGGYVAGRSVEKVAETVTSNIDLAFLKKKDRAEDLKK